MQISSPYASFVRSPRLSEATDQLVSEFGPEDVRSMVTYILRSLMLSPIQEGNSRQRCLVLSLVAASKKLLEGRGLAG